MLTRGTKSVYVCLQYRKHLFGTNLISSGTAHSVTGRILRRWQSAATPRVAPEDTDYIRESDNTGPANGLHPNSHQGDRAQSNGNRQRWRKWRPRPTAILGVNSLGKPAEVLLLPSRDRKIPQAPIGDGSERAGTTLQESIDSEKIPLSGAKLAENIEQTRSQVGKMRGQLEKHEWKALRRNLRSGFQTAQLKRYIRLRTGGDFPPAGLAKNPRKDEIIRYVAEEIWGFTTPALDELSLSSEEPGEQAILSLRLRGGIPQLEHLLMHPTQPLKRIAEDYHVQIKVYPSQMRLSVTGPDHHANQALQRLKRYKKALGWIVVQLHGPLKILDQGHSSTFSLGAYLKSLQRKYHGLNITQDEDKIKILHRNDDLFAAHQARREILLSVPSNSGAQRLIVWPCMDEVAFSLQPSPTPAELPLTLHHHKWSRLVSTLAIPQTPNLTSGNASFSRTLQTLKETFGGDVTLGRGNNRQGLYYDITAKFGHALTQDNPSSIEAHKKEGGAGKILGPAELVSKMPTNGEAATRSDLDKPERGSILTVPDLSAEASSNAEAERSEAPKAAAFASSAFPDAPENTVFAGGGSFLPQHLSCMDPWIRRQSERPKDVNENARVILRLELAPVWAPDSSGPPTIEIFVTAVEAADGRSPQLQIARASSIHHEDNCTILCPENDVDVNFVRQLKRDLAFPGSAESGITESLMDAVREYIGHAQSTGSSDWVFPPFVTLHIHHKMTNAFVRAKRPLDKAGPGRPTGKTYKTIEYFLRTVDVIDVDSRTLSVETPAPSTRSKKQVASRPEPDFCVDHITYTGSDTTRQELRLARTPLLYPPALTPPRMSTFLKAALQLAEQLSRNPTNPGAKHESWTAQIKDLEDADADATPDLAAQPSATKDTSGKKAWRKAALKAQRRKAKEPRERVDTAHLSPSTSNSPHP